jgi:hypothetical protein
VAKLLAELDAMTEDDWIEADSEPAEGEVVISVPKALLPEIRQLLAEWQDQDSADSVAKPS